MREKLLRMAEISVSNLCKYCKNQNECTSKILLDTTINCRGYVSLKDITFCSEWVEEE